MDRKPNFQQTTSATLSLNKMTCEKNISLFMPLNTTRGFGNTADVMHLMFCPFGSNEASCADATHPNESRMKMSIVAEIDIKAQCCGLKTKQKTKNDGEKNEAKKLL